MFYIFIREIVVSVVSVVSFTLYEFKYSHKITTTTTTAIPLRPLKRMIGWIVQATALSLCLIAVLHYLYVFFKTTLTVPKVKDLVNRPQKQYDAIFKTMGGNTNHNNHNNHNNVKINASSASTTDISSLPILGSSDIGRESNAMAMKQELKHFLKELNSNSNNR